MTSDSRSRPGPARFRGGLILVFALILGIGMASSRQAAFAGVHGAGDGSRPTAIDGAGSKALVVAEKGNKNWSKGNNNKNWSKSNGNNNKNHHGNKNWSKNNNKNWGNYNNHYIKNWNKRAYMRNWNRKPYYGEFIGGIVLGSILATNGVGIVPYAPDPNLCWYWADPYMERGYWDYCY